MALVEDLIPERTILILIPDYRFGEPCGDFSQRNRERNYLETSASSMFVYFLYKLVRNGILTGQPAETARGAAKAGYSSLVKKMLREEPSGELHLAGICSVAGLGGDPYRDGSFDYYVKEPVVEDDFKGAGPFILASMESEQA